jgi:thiamine biosynthesis protein ThiC
MDNGVAAEFNSPKELLANKGGIFSAMVNETGRSTSKLLRSVASGASTMQDTRATLARSASAGVGRIPKLNALQLAQQIAQDAKEADTLLDSLACIVEDQVQPFCVHQMVTQLAVEMLNML